MNGRIVAGRYELATVLGQGGMGNVWTAYDRRLDRRVAVKLLNPGRVAGGAENAEEIRGRFERECRTTAQVDHHGLVTVYDAGSEGDELYLIMQFVEGRNLADHLEEHSPYPWPWAVAVAAQLCAVLAAVHAVPIVHRDLKPRNVMIRPDGTVVVLDLGVAAVLDSPDTTRLTQTGIPVGTPAYMAPEQAMGGAVGPRTDLYALGVLLYELLSGDVPFSGSSALGVLHSHLYEQPVPVRKHRPEVPEALEAFVLRLLAKDQRDRPADAQQAYQELAPLLPAPGSYGLVSGHRAMDPTRPLLHPHAPWPPHPTTDQAAAPAASTAPALPAARALPAAPAAPAAVEAVNLPTPPAGTPVNPPTLPAGTPVTGTPPAGTPVVAASVAAVEPLPADPLAVQPPAALLPAPLATVPLPALVSRNALPLPGPLPYAPSYAQPQSSASVSAAVEEVKRLLEVGRITQAVDILSGVLPAAVQWHGEHSPVVRMLRQQYAATLMADGQYRRALPELRYLAEEHAAESGPLSRPSLRYRYEAAQCLEQIGEAQMALAEYRALLPYFEQYRATEPDLPLELRRRIGQLLLSLGDRAGAQDVLARLLFDGERLHGPHHPFSAELRRVLGWLGQVRR